jgi:hypothetical protein
VVAIFSSRKDVIAIIVPDWEESAVGKWAALPQGIVGQQFSGEVNRDMKYSVAECTADGEVNRVDMHGGETA